MTGTVEKINKNLVLSWIRFPSTTCIQCISILANFDITGTATNFDHGIIPRTSCTCIFVM